LGLVAPALAADVTDADRLFRNFAQEAAVIEKGQVRIEVRGITLHNEQKGDGLQVILRGFPAGDSDPEDNQDPIKRRDDIREVSGGIVDLVGSYGLFKNTEVGFVLPAVLQGLRFSDATENNNDFGDLALYGKYRRRVTERISVAGGLEAELPTGSERKRLGTGEVGTMPFLSVRYTRGAAAVGAHVGYQFHTDDLDDVFQWSAQAILRGRQSYAIRAEVAGRHFDYGGASFDDVVVYPGIDYNYSANLTFRPTALAGITDEALDWGLGLGVSYTF